jgi:hypothetical protein
MDVGVGSMFSWEEAGYSLESKYSLEVASTRGRRWPVKKVPGGK